MKKIIRNKLSAIIIIAMILSLMLNYCVQVLTAQRDMRKESQDLFWQIKQILDQNAREAEEIQEDFNSKCLIQAKAAAYIVQYRPEITNDLEEIQKVAELLQVDELHIFDEEGNLYFGSEPKYFGYNFNSGDQMQFFLPLLEDRSLELCQPITPNTAEGKLMQYAAVWQEDGKGIVQIGMEPERVLDAMKKNELSYIFSLVTADRGAVLYAIDPDTHQILGSTDQKLVGRTTEDLGIDPEKMSRFNKGYHYKIDGEHVYGTFTESCSVILGRTCLEKSIYNNVNLTSGFLAMYLLIVSIVLILAISRYLEHDIIKGIDEINEKLLKITEGNLDETVDVKTVPEFRKLSGSINQMVKSLLDTTNKISMVLERAKLPIGVYEYRRGMKRVMTTSRFADILQLSKEEEKALISDKDLFSGKLSALRIHSVDEEQEIFQIKTKDGKDRFVQIQSFVHDYSTMGIVVDVTENVVEKKQIEYERDVDLLTRLYSRRAFYSQMDELFLHLETLGRCVLIMADADNLKQVNDRYGHENGDIYLRETARILQQSNAQKQLTARLSGDEFAVFIYGADSLQTLYEYINTIENKMKDGFAVLTGGEKIPVRFSMGCAFYPGDGTDYHRMLKLADERMYENKKMRKIEKEELSGL